MTSLSRQVDFVDGILGFAGAKQAAGDHDLAEIAVFRRTAAIFVIEGDRNLSHAGCRQAIAAGEDHILHLMAAQVTGALLAHGPAQGVDDIGLAAAVRADDRRDAGIKFHGRLLGEGLKPNHFKAFEAHFLIQV